VTALTLEIGDLYQGGIVAYILVGYSCAALSLHVTRAARPPQRREEPTVTLRVDNDTGSTAEGL
jgi:hypothetical protein